ncbi:hypothetical protein RND81_03G233600 [Saponaria officinalis]|uniref:Glucan endo-1,3-beta-D-glucosidase n=1 Tax=Saponaria officinalis TaxID=3572 RepID=A0AAW1M2G2_SAPOF
MAFVFQKMIFLVQFCVIVINIHLRFASAEFGVVFGMFGDNLPAPKDVVALYKSEGIPLIRLLEPRAEVLDALRASGIRVVVGVKNSDIEGIASNTNTAIEWVHTHIVPYAMDVRFVLITVGNDLIPGPDADHVGVAMNNIQSGLNTFNLTNIMISTVVSTAVLEVAPLPSAGEFTPAAKTTMKMILYWLHGTNNPLLISVDPYNAHVSDLGKVPLGFATFNSYGYVMADGQYEYDNHFEAVVDTFYVALEKSEGDTVKLMVAETGWPTAGNEPHTSIENAHKYNQGLITTVSNRGGTPRRPDTELDVFINSMYNEDQKPPGDAQYWGLHYPNGTRVYDLSFS